MDRYHTSNATREKINDEAGAEDPLPTCTLLAKMMLSPAEHDALNGGVPPVLARTTQSRKTHSARCTTKEGKHKDGEHKGNRI